MLLLFATAFVVGQELVFLIGEVVRVQGKWFIFEFKEPCNSFLSPFEAENDVYHVLTDDRATGISDIRKSVGLFLGVFGIFGKTKGSQRHEDLASFGRQVQFFQRSVKFFLNVYNISNKYLVSALEKNQLIRAPPK